MCVCYISQRVIYIYRRSINEHTRYTIKWNVSRRYCWSVLINELFTAVRGHYLVSGETVAIGA